MSKLRADSKWNGLTGDQLDTLEAWLFDEHVSYREALERIEKEFGVKASLPSLARYYQRLASQRLEAELAGLTKTTDDYEENHGRLQKLGPAAMMLVANRLWQLAANHPGNVRDLASLARVLLENDAIEVKRRWVELEEIRYDHETRMEEIKDLAQQKSNAEMKAVVQQLIAGTGLAKPPTPLVGGPS
jgi:hypothetical protein